MLVVANDDEPVSARIPKTRARQSNQFDWVRHFQERGFFRSALYTKFPSMTIGVKLFDNHKINNMKEPRARFTRTLRVQS